MTLRRTRKPGLPHARAHRAAISDRFRSGNRGSPRLCRGIPDGLSTGGTAGSAYRRPNCRPGSAATRRGHSLRAGFLTAAAADGASIFKMKEVSRHRSTDVLARYVRSAGCRWSRRRWLPMTHHSPTRSEVTGWNSRLPVSIGQQWRERIVLLHGPDGLTLEAPDVSFGDIEQLRDFPRTEPIARPMP